MSLFRPSLESSPSVAPAEAEVRRTSEILGEAIMDSVSSVRDSLPEQHRIHFETLRQEIIDFTKVHGIPKESLTKPDLLREATCKLFTSDLERLANLLERFEYLLKNGEPKKEDYTEALEYAEEFYHLREQYTSQVSLLEQVGILKEGAIIGIDGKKYPIPTLEQIASRLFERRETLETKHDQGFTKLLFVPFGMSLDSLREILTQFLLKHKKFHPSFDFDINQPLWTSEEYQGADIGDSPKLVYYQQSFMEDGHGGKTKAQILEGQETLGQARGDDGWKGWTIHLLQPSNMDEQDTETLKGFAPIPRKGQGTPQGDLTSRPSLEAGKSPNEYLSLLQEAQDNPNSPYHNESGLTPEDWIIAFMTHLEETGKPMDNWQNGTESISYLTGAFFPSSVLVPYAYWYRGGRRVGLFRGDPPYRDGDIGARFSVVV